MYLYPNLAHLVYDVPTPIYSSTEYGPAIGTEAERDQRWAAIDFSEGIIALPDHLALQYGLPLSERFPWDQTQGVYLLGAHHGIHCLVCGAMFKFILPNSVLTNNPVSRNAYMNLSQTRTKAAHHLAHMNIFYTVLTAYCRMSIAMQMILLG